MKKILYFVFVSLVFFSCKDDDVFVEDEESTLRGLFGTVSVYDANGNAVGDGSGVKILAHIQDTLAEDSLGNPTQLFDTTISTVSHTDGAWQFMDCPRGYYTLSITSDGFGENGLYKYWYDTTSADTLDNFVLATKPNASVELNSILYSDGIIEISRDVTYTASAGLEYPVVTWYFFDTLPNASKESYVYSYMSGAAYGNPGETKNLVIEKPIDKLLESGFYEGDSVYVRAYVDNFKYTSYQIDDEKREYPNITGESSVHSFYITPTEIE